MEPRDRNSSSAKSEVRKKVAQDSSEKRAGKFNKARGLDLPLGGNKPQKKNNQNNQNNNQKNNQRNQNQNQKRNNDNNNNNNNRQGKRNNNNQDSKKGGNQGQNLPQNFKITVKNSNPPVKKAAASSAKRFATRRTGVTVTPRFTVQNTGIRKRTKAPVKAINRTARNVGNATTGQRLNTALRSQVSGIRRSGLRVRQTAVASSAPKSNANASTLNERFGGKKLVVRRGLKSLTSASPRASAAPKRAAVGGRRVILR